MPLGAGAFAAAHVTSLPVSARASLSCRSHEWVRVAAAEEFDPLKRTRTADAEAQDCGSHAMLASGAHSLSRKCSAAVGTLPHHLHASATAIASESKSEDADATVSVTCCVCSEKTHIETRAQVISQEFLDALFRNRTLEMRLQVLKALTTYVRGWLVDGETGKPVNSQNPNVKEVLGSLPLTDGVPMAHSIMARIGFKFNPVDGGWYRPVGLQNSEYALNKCFAKNARSEEQFALALGAFEELTLLNYNLKSSMGTISPTEASFVDHTSGMRILRSWLGADASEPKRADSENNEYLNPHFKRLGVSEDVSDNELEYAFSKQLHDDPSLKSLYLDSLIEIVQSRPNSYGLQEFVAVERTKHNIHSTSELASAYGLLNLPPPKFHEIDEVHSQRIPADMLVSLFTAQVHSSPALLDDLRASLRIVAAEEGCEDEVDVFLATGFAPATSAADDNFLGMDLAPSVTIADSTRPIGLENFGNICYLNALVQFYLTIKPLRRALFALPAMGNSSPTSSSPSKNADRSRSFLMLLRDLFVRLSSGDPQATSVGIGRAFALAVAASAVPSGRTVATLSGTAGEETVEDDHGVVGRSADLLLNVQQDVGEFMHVFVEMVEKGFATLGDTKSSEYLKELFVGKTVQTVQYQNMHGSLETDTNKEEFLYLMVDLKSNILEALDAYFSPVTVDYENKKAIQNLKIQKLPPILTLVLRRVQFDVANGIAFKSNGFMLFYNDISLEQYLTPEANRKPRNYRLHAVLEHEGEANYGHYRIYIRDHSVTDKWFLYDDSRISVLKSHEVFRDPTSFPGRGNANAYCLMYVDSAVLDSTVETFVRGK